MGLPDEPVTRLRQVLNNRHIFSVTNRFLFQNGIPMLQQHLSIEVVEETQVGQKGTS